MRRSKIQTPTGMHDILPEDQKYYQKILDVCQKMADFYHFKRIETPILENLELFSRGVGLATDIVEKQMFTLRTKGGDYLALRPEGTAPIARAFIQHGFQNLPQPVKLWYFGPFFRYEHPQAGRFRQFWQAGFEVLGEKSPAIDAQIIQIFYNIFQELKARNLVIEINSIGDSQCRPYYKKLLVNYLKSRAMVLCSNCRRRIKVNPLRVLDCKEEKCQRIIAGAPQIIDHLCQECKNHFKEVLEFLDELGLPYHLNPYLVRGLDYYTKTVFEIFEDSKEGKEIGALGGGGRYDNLIKFLGGKEVAGCGAAFGVERVIYLMKQRGARLKEPSLPKIFLAQLGRLAKRKALRLIEEFRKNKIPVSESLSRDSLKAQLKIADRLGARYALILGQQEALKGEIIIRDMETGKQKTVKLEKVIKEVQKLLKKLK